MDATYATASATTTTMSRAASGAVRRRPYVLDPEDVRLNFNPEAPQRRFALAGLAAAFDPPGAGLPQPVPWPRGLAPKPVALPRPPAQTDDLSRFAGYDVVVVTWTSAEAAALASLLTPGVETSSWYEYRHGIASYIPLVTGGSAPFNDRSTEMARYYHSLGLYYPCTIGDKRVLLVKSGLHLDYDGPATPVRQLMGEIARTVRPKLFITTGTGGGIGAATRLGDVIVAGAARFDCREKFAAEPWAKASYQSASITKQALAAMTPGLMGVNAKRIPGARATPVIYSTPTDDVVTTDFFAFDDSTDFYKLQGLGRVCDMGDAMVAQSLQGITDLTWYSIRNASDPQIPNPNNDIKAAAKTSSQIYAKYGGLTSAASVIASWAVITTF